MPGPPPRQRAHPGHPRRPGERARGGQLGAGAGATRPRRGGGGRVVEPGRRGRRRAEHAARGRRVASPAGRAHRPRRRLRRRALRHRLRRGAPARPPRAVGGRHRRSRGLHALARGGRPARRPLAARALQRTAGPAHGDADDGRAVLRILRHDLPTRPRELPTSDDHAPARTGVVGGRASGRAGVPGRIRAGRPLLDRRGGDVPSSLLERAGAGPRRGVRAGGRPLGLRPRVRGRGYRGGARPRPGGRAGLRAVRGRRGRAHPTERRHLPAGRGGRRGALRPPARRTPALSGRARGRSGRRAAASALAHEPRASR